MKAKSIKKLDGKKFSAYLVNFHRIYWLANLKVKYLGVFILLEVFDNFGWLYPFIPRDFISVDEARQQIK
jgi:hypothetical protein